MVDRYHGITFFAPRGNVAQDRRSRVAMKRVSTVRPPPAPAIDPETRAFIHSVLSCSGLNPAFYRIEPLARRLPACLRALKAKAIDEARRRTERDAGLRSLALATLVIGVTEFFRDPPVFDFLRDHVMPEAGRRGDSLRIWSAGCSEGAELYSSAMLLAELGLLDRSELLGTDCRPEAVAAAREGWYDESRVAGVGAERVERFFSRRRRHLRIAETLRTAARWETSDLLDDKRIAGDWDLILCRNVAIYLEPAAAATLWCSLAQRLRPDGVLVVGKAERPDASAGLRRLAPCIYQRT